MKGTQKVWHLEGLHEVVIRPVASRLDRRFDRPVRGHHNGRHGRVCGLDPREELNSVYPRQAVVSQQQVNRSPVQNIQGVLRAGHGDNLEPGGLQSSLQRKPKDFVVVDNQNPNAHRAAVGSTWDARMTVNLNA
jgi:hypothetical protein